MALKSGTKREIVLDSFPNNLNIDPEVFVNYYISHIDHFSPWDLRMKRFDMRRDAASGLSNDGHIVQYGLYGSGIGIELLISQAFIRRPISSMASTMSSILNRQSLLGIHRLFEDSVP